MAVKVSSSFSNNKLNNPFLLKDFLGVSIESFFKPKSTLVNHNTSSYYAKEFMNKSVFDDENRVSTTDLLVGKLPATQRNLYISPIKCSVVVSRVGNVSRTTKGGRRRQVSAHGVEVGNGSWVAYAAKVKAKSSQRFMAFEKISCLEVSKFQRARHIEMMRNFKNKDYFAGHHQKKVVVGGLSTNFDQKLAAGNITFFDKEGVRSLPTKPMVASTKGTKTILGFGSYRCDNKAEPAQYSILSLLGVKNGFVKNHGSKNEIVRVSNMISNLKNVYPTVNRIRKYGVDPLRSLHSF
jgi:ribosomal protein S5